MDLLNCLPLLLLSGAITVTCSRAALVAEETLSLYRIYCCCSLREWLYMNIQTLSSSSSSPGPLFPRKSFSCVPFFCALLLACPINRSVPFNRRHVQKSTSSHPFMNQQSVFPVPVVQRKIETRHRMIILLRPDWPLAIPMNDIAHRLRTTTRTLAWRKLRISAQNWLITSAIRDSPFDAPYRHPNGISHMFFMLRMWLYVSHVCHDIPPCPVHQKVAVVWWRSEEKIKQKTVLPKSSHFNIYINSHGTVSTGDVMWCDMIHHHHQRLGKETGAREG